MDTFSRELAWRIQHVQPDPEMLVFASYVRWGRGRRGLDRETFAQRAGIDRALVSFLENGLLQPCEFTRQLRWQIEHTIGVSYPTFLRQETSQQDREGRSHILNLISDWVGIAYEVVRSFATSVLLRCKGIDVSVLFT